MAVQNFDGFIRLTAAATITPGLLVTPTGTLCGVSTTKTHVGVALDNAVSGGLFTAINPVGKHVKCVASVAISAGAAVYYAANGQVGTTSASNTQIGVAIDAASGAGSIIEVAFV